jgi:6,7-dimethyl-8-ribityllumazine synthase
MRKPKLNEAGGKSTVNKVSAVKKSTVAAKAKKPRAAKISVYEGELEGDGLRIGVVQSRFNEDICGGLRDACVEELLALGVSQDDIFVCTVPGALEIPLVLQRLAASDQFDALVALGAVIRGETYHFELVSNEIGRGVSQVQTDMDTPVANGVLTCDTEEQARERIVEKAQDCARCAVEMANLLIALQGLSDVDA